MWIAILVILVIAIAAIYYKSRSAAGKAGAAGKSAADGKASAVLSAATTDLPAAPALPAAVSNLTTNVAYIPPGAFQSLTTWTPVSGASSYVLTFTPSAGYGGPVSVTVPGSTSSYKGRKSTLGVYPNSVVSIYAVNASGRGPTKSTPPGNLVM